MFPFQFREKSSREHKSFFASGWKGNETPKDTTEVTKRRDDFS